MELKEYSVFRNSLLNHLKLYRTEWKEHLLGRHAESHLKFEETTFFKTYHAKYISMGYFDNHNNVYSYIDNFEYFLNNKVRLNKERAFSNFLFNIDKSIMEFNAELFFYLIGNGYANMDDCIKGNCFLFELREISDFEISTYYNELENLPNPKNPNDTEFWVNEFYRTGLSGPSSLYLFDSDFRSFTFLKNTIPHFLPSNLEIELLRKLISTIENYKGVTKSDLIKQIKIQVFPKLSKSRININLIYLGLLGILMPENNKPIFELGAYNTYKERGLYSKDADSYYPLNNWTPKDGINYEYLDYWFKDYFSK